MRHRQLWPLLLSCAALSCGRVGFELEGPDAIAVDGQDGQDGEVLNAPSAEPLRCAGLDVLLCADFEDGTMPASAQSQSAQNGSVFVSNGVLVTRTESGRASAQLELSFESVEAGALFLRMRMRVPSGFRIDELDFAALEGSSYRSQGIVSFALLDDETFGVDFDDGDRAEDAYALPRDRFVCLSMTLDVADGDGMVEVSADDHAVLSTRRKDTLPGRAIRSLRVGLESRGYRQSGAELHIDDVLLDTAPLPDC